jgi:activator of HSP90 ATPase
MAKKFSFRLTSKKKETEKQTKKEREASSGQPVSPVDTAYTKEAPVLKTVVDELYQLILDKKKVNISDAAKRFGVSEEVILEWGKILEEHSLVEVRYPAFGKAFLVVKETAKKRK